MRIALAGAGGAGGAFVPFTIEGDGFGGGGYATSVLIDFFNEEIDCGRADFLGLLVGPADFSFFGSPV